MNGKLIDYYGVHESNMYIISKVVNPCSNIEGGAGGGINFERMGGVAIHTACEISRARRIAPRHL